MEEFVDFDQEDTEIIKEYKPRFWLKHPVDQLRDPQFAILVEYVASGGNAIQWCHRNMNVPYFTMMCQVNSNETWRQMYDRAREDRAEWYHQHLLMELKSLAFTDIKDLYEENNCLKNIADIPESARKAIAAIEVDEIWQGTGKDRQIIGHTRKVKLWDKKGSIETFMKHLGMFIERIEMKKEISYKIEKFDIEARISSLTSRISGVN